MNNREIGFIGKITAGVTHEINNALASIKEISGLLEDLVSMSSVESFPHKEKFQNVLPRIQQQVKRGVKLTTELNKFSHLADEPEAEVELNDFISHLVFLTERFARMKNVELSYKPTSEQISFTTFPIQLQMAVYNCIVHLLNSSSAGGKIIIRAIISKDKCSIVINYEGGISGNRNLFSESSSAEEIEIIKKVNPLLNDSVELNTSAKSMTLNIKTNLK